MLNPLTLSGLKTLSFLLSDDRVGEERETFVKREGGVHEKWREGAAGDRLFSSRRP